MKTTIDEIKERIVREEILTAQTALVEECLRKEIFPYDDIENTEVYPEYFDKYAKFAGGSSDELNEEIERLSEMQNEFERFTNPEYDKIQDEIDNLRNLDVQTVEIFEYWAVTKWLADELAENNYPVIRNDYGYWMGRTTTGQQIIIDAIIEQIATEIVTA